MFSKGCILPIIIVIKPLKWLDLISVLRCIVHTLVAGCRVEHAEFDTLYYWKSRLGDAGDLCNYLVFSVLPDKFAWFLYE